MTRTVGRGTMGSWDGRIGAELCGDRTMSMNRKPSLPSTLTKAQWVRVLVLGAVYLWCVGVALGLWFGRPFSKAALDAATTTLAGFLGWSIAYRISHRNEAQALVGSPLFVIPNMKLDSLVFSIAIPFFVVIPTAVVGGLILRALTAPRAGPPSSNPLYDASIDRPG
jgi:hypothetical protein